MSKNPMHDEQYRELEQHHDAVHHANRVRKTQTLGKRSKAQRRFAGVPICSDCRLPIVVCKCQWS